MTITDEERDYVSWVFDRIRHDAARQAGVLEGDPVDEESANRML